ncbi:MAG: SRPBCC family protein [Solirubrobacterales bacterium]|nr:SRPBCC family protein [Solirubrobacterales bacterium]
MKILREGDLPASPAAVLEVLADLPRWEEWFAMHKGWSSPPPARAETGARFKHRVRVLGAPGEVSWKILAFDAPGSCVLEGKGPSRTSLGLEIRVVPADAGSHITFDATIGGLLVKPIESQLRNWLDTGIDRTLTNLTVVLA